MTQERRDSSEVFYSFFSLIKPHRAGQDSNTDEWSAHVLPHGSIQELAPGLWHVTGTLPVAPREMVIYKLADSGLLIHSAIALDEAGMEKLESLGKPKIMIVPNRIHKIDAGVYKRRYPELLVVTPEVAKPHVEEEVPVDATAEELLSNYEIVCHQPAGIRPQELVYELPLSMGKALIFTDILFNLTESYLNTYMPRSKLIFRLLGASGYFGITALGKRFFMTDKVAYREWLQDLADSNPSLCVISVAHGEPITMNCPERLREAAARLS